MTGHQKQGRKTIAWAMVFLIGGIHSAFSYLAQKVSKQFYAQQTPFRSENSLKQNQATPYPFSFLMPPARFRACFSNLPVSAPCQPTNLGVGSSLSIERLMPTSGRGARCDSRESNRIQLIPSRPPTQAGMQLQVEPWLNDNIRCFG